MSHISKVTKYISIIFDCGGIHYKVSYINNVSKEAILADVKELFNPDEIVSVKGTNSVEHKAVLRSV